MPVVLLEWRAYRRNTLFGFAHIQVGALRIRDVSVHALGNKSWAGMPSKPIISGSSVQIGDNGKPRYVAMLEWTSKEAGDRFSQGVIAALLAEHPDALDPSAAS
jgi:hypothetical protein